MTDMLRLIRAGNAAVFDRMLASLIAANDLKAATWLRTGIPAEAGMMDAYRAALASSVPELWLVGAALALKENRLESAAFLERVAAMTPDAMGLAAAVAKRYLAGRLADQDARLGPILAASAARSLATWLAVIPPGDAVTAALTRRLRDPVTAELTATALQQRLGEDRAHWEAPIRAMAANANGRLDHLLR